MTLFINACVRKNSRTERLAKCLLGKLEQKDGPLTEVRLASLDFPVADGAFLERRDSLLSNGALQDPLFDLAHQFAAADRIVIAAPYWDLSFPAALKQYLEQVNVVGITFRYSPEGIPVGLCRAKELWYVTTAGGPYVPHDFGFGYVKALAESYYGIPDVRLVKAEGLDIVGADAEKILKEAEEKIQNIYI